MCPRRGWNLKVLLVVVKHDQDGNFISQLAQIDDSHGPRQMHYSTTVFII